MVKTALFSISVAGMLLCANALVASISPNDVIVVYNSNYQWSAMSKAVADYYCSARGIPAANEIGVDVPIPVSRQELIYPAEYVQHIQSPLRTFLSSRPGFDINNPGSDPTKCVVLCHGIPLRIDGTERKSSVDSSLALLFSSTSWGTEPIGGFGGSRGVTNPYYYYNSTILRIPLTGAASR